MRVNPRALLSEACESKEWYVCTYFPSTAKLGDETAARARGSRGAARRMSERDRMAAGRKWVF